MQVEVNEPAEAIYISYGFTSAAEKTFNIFFHTGDMCIGPSEITIECTSKSSGGTAIGGIVGGAIGATAVSMIAQSIQTSFQIDPAKSELVYDDHRREISIRLSPDRWIAIMRPWRMGRAAREEDFTQLLDALKPLFGSRARQGRLGKWSRKIKLLIGFVMVTLVAAAAFFTALAIMDSGRR